MSEKIEQVIFNGIDIFISKFLEDDKMIVNEKTFDKLREWNLKMSENLKPSDNNERDEICECNTPHFLAHINRYGINIKFCCICGRKLSPVS